MSGRLNTTLEFAAPELAVRLCAPAVGGDLILVRQLEDFLPPAHVALKA